MTGKLIGQHQLLKWPLLSQLLHELAFPPHPSSKSTSMVVIDLALVVTRGHAPQVWVGLLLGSLPPPLAYSHPGSELAWHQQATTIFPSLRHSLFCMSSSLQEESPLWSFPSLQLSPPAFFHQGERGQREQVGREKPTLLGELLTPLPHHCFISFETPACHGRNFFTDAQINEDQWRSTKEKGYGSLPLFAYLFVCGDAWRKNIMRGPQRSFLLPNDCFWKSRWCVLLKIFFFYISNSNNKLNSLSQQPHILLSRAGDLWLIIPSEIQNPVKQQRFGFNPSEINRCLAPCTKYRQWEAPMECMKEGIPETLSQSWSQCATLGDGKGSREVPGEEFKFYWICFVTENLQQYEIPKHEVIIWMLGYICRYWKRVRMVVQWRLVENISAYVQWITASQFCCLESLSSI